MQILSEPLRMTEAENRKALEASERRGDPNGNRHERRLAAKMERAERKLERAAQ